MDAPEHRLIHIVPDAVQVRAQASHDLGRSTGILLKMVQICWITPSGALRSQLGTAFDGSRPLRSA